MKKFLSLLLAMLMLIPAAAFAQSEAAPVNVYVSITDAQGALVLACEPVAVTDLDADGALTINDALVAAHTAHHPDGAAAYLSEESQWGLSLMKLWGVENGGSYGYYKNDASAWSLLDPVAEGDHVKAFVYTDVAAFSDTYCFFDAHTVAAGVGSEVALTLMAAAFDENWAPIQVPVADAVLTINGEATQVRTDAEGKAVLTFAESGVYVVSAQSETMLLVAPVCVVTVGE